VLQCVQCVAVCSMCCSVFSVLQCVQCVAVCSVCCSVFSVLQYVAVCGSVWQNPPCPNQQREIPHVVLQCVAMRRSMVPCGAVCYRVLTCVAVCCNCVAVSAQLPTANA